MYLSLTEKLIEKKSFRFSRVTGYLIHERVVLEPGGILEGFRSHNEATWSVESGNLVFRDPTGEITTVFDELVIEDGIFHFKGRFLLGNPNEHWHLLDENHRIKHAPAPLVKEDFTTKNSDNNVALLVRTHKADEKFRDLMQKLEINRTGFDIYPIVDNTSPVPVNDRHTVIWHSVDAARNLGLTQTPRGLMHDCGDIPFYFAFREIPEYRHYLMIEDDVDLVRSDATYINRICARLSEPDFAEIDFAGLEYKPIPNTFSWGVAAGKYFPQRHCYWAYFPIVLLSRRAIAFLFSQRQLEAIRDPAIDDVIHCETFVASSLHAGGFRCHNIRDLVPESYDWETMAMQMGELSTGKPMGSKISVREGIEVVHPIYTHEEYLNRLYRKFIVSRRDDWPNLITRLYSEEAVVVSDTLKKELRDKIPQQYRHLCPPPADAVSHNNGEEPINEGIVDETGVPSDWLQKSN